MKQFSLSSEFCSVDAHLFEEEIQKTCTGTVDPAAIQYALSLYTGNFLEIEDDERWHIRKRDDLRDLYIQASLLLFNHYKNNNAVKTGLPCLVRALKYDPHNETVLAQVMEGHLSLGKRSKANEIYEASHHAGMTNE